MFIKLSVESHALGTIELTAPDYPISAGEDQRVNVADAAQGLVDRLIGSLGLAKAEDPELALLRGKAAAYDAIAEEAAKAQERNAEEEPEIDELRAKLTETDTE